MLRNLLEGCSGWARLQKNGDRKVETVDTAITVVGTLLVAVTWMIVLR